MSKPGKLTAMISSTAVDLPEHRKQAMDGCLRAGVFPIAMEHLPDVELNPQDEFWVDPDKLDPPLVSEVA